MSEYYAQYGAFPSAVTTTGAAPAAAAACGGSIAAPANSVGKYATVTVGAGGQIQVTYNGAATNAKLAGADPGHHPGW